MFESFCYIFEVKYVETAENFKLLLVMAANVSRVSIILNGMGFQRKLGTAVSLFAVTVVCCK